MEQWQEIVAPWKEAAEGWGKNSPKKYIFPEDEKAVEEYQGNHENSSNYKLHLDLPPHPFAGNPDAPIWIINLNPGYHAAADTRDFGKGEQGHDWALKQLTGEMSYNYYFGLENHGEIEKGACYWWTKYLLNQSICKGNLDLAQKKFFSLDYFAYHTIKFCPPDQQEHPFEHIKLFKKIVKWGIENKKLFLVMRVGIRDVFNEDKDFQKHVKAGMVLAATSRASWISYNNLRMYDIPDSKEDAKKAIHFALKLN